MLRIFIANIELFEEKQDSKEDAYQDKTTEMENESFYSCKTYSSADNTSITVPTEWETGENLVWVPTNGGTKYHRKSSCSKMKNPLQVFIDTAKTNGYTACKKCYYIDRKLGRGK